MRATTFGWLAMLVATTEQHVFNRADKHQTTVGLRMDVMTMFDKNATASSTVINLIN